MVRKRAKASQFQQLMRSVRVAVLIIDEESGKITYINETVCEDLMMEPVQILQRHYQHVFTPDFCDFYESIKMNCTCGIELMKRFFWKERCVWEQVYANRITWSDNKPAVSLAITNLPELMLSARQYEQVAYIDDLLEIPNGFKLEEDIRALDDPDKVALVYMRVVHFDNINDLYGFDVGDALLIQIRDWLMESETRRAQLYRVTNGFAILGRKVSRADGDDRAVQIIQRFREPWFVSVRGTLYTIYCNVNVGVVYSKYVNNEMRNLLMRTSRAPKNDAGYAVYDEAVDAAVKRDLLLRQTLNNCVLQGMTGFSVSYQPIVDGKTCQWVGAEALCRWTTPDGEIIPPLTFIHMAEQMGLIEQIDNWVRDTAMTQCMEWGLQHKRFTLDVNFSPVQSISDAFIDGLLDSLRRTGYPALHLNMEITESTKMPFNAENVRGIHRLRDEGVALSLDDFGTGYSSFENLLKIPGALLKTEKMFLDNLENSLPGQYLIHSIVNIGHHLDMQIVSEGVETQGQYDLLKQYGVDFMQGYLFSRPLTEEQFAGEMWRFEDREDDTHNTTM